MGTPPNLLVWEPGGYRFSEYVKVGAGLSLVCLIVGVIIVPWHWPVFGAGMTAGGFRAARRIKGMLPLCHSVTAD